MNHKFHVMAFAGLGLALLLLASCAKSDRSRVLIETNSLQTMSDDGFRLQHVVINVRGPGMPLTTFRWDGGGHDGMAPKDPPEHFEVLVPPGSQRLIQFLGVYKNSQESMRFRYGDTTMSFGAGDVAVDIRAHAYGGESQEISLKGQFVRANNTTPTGQVEWLFTPPDSTKPLIYIEDDFIYGGWFEFQTFEGVPITYRMKDSGEVLFDGLVPAYLDTQLSSVSAFAKLTFPDYYYGRPEDGITRCFPDKSTGSIYYMGYFGPGASLRADQFAVLQGSTPLAFQEMVQSEYYGLFHSCDDEVVPDPEASALVWDSESSVRIEGGQREEECGGPEFCLDPRSFLDGPRKAFSEGPFRIRPYTSSDEYHHQGAFTFNYGSGTPHYSSIRWRVLKGVEQAVDRFEVYTRPALGGDDSHRDLDEGIETLGCRKFLGERGFKLHTTVRTPVSSEQTDTFQVHQGMSHYTGKDLVVCPFFKVNGKVVEGKRVAIAFTHPEATIEGLPEHYYDGSYYFADHPVLKVKGVFQSQFKFGLSVECEGEAGWVGGPLSGPLPITFAGEGHHSLCLRVRNLEGEAWSDPFHYSLVHDPTPPSAPEITCELNEFYDIRATFPKPMGPDHHDEIISYFKVWRANASGAVVGDAFDLSQGTPEGASLLVRIPSADNSPEEHLRVEVGPVPDRTGRMSPAAFKVFDSDCIEVP